jgi:predicted nuclease with TOPRIM domain
MLKELKDRVELNYVYSLLTKEVMIMSQSPITVTYSLEEILGEIKQSIKSLDQRFDKIDERFDKVDQRLDKMNERLTHLEIGQARLEERFSGDIKTLEEKVDGVSKRIDNQEFVSRGILVGLILAFLAGLAKFFGIVGTPS